MHTLGFDEEARDFMEFLVGVLERTRACRSCTGSTGEGPDRSTLDHLSGYGGARPVRIGNGAFCQRQNDVWGAIMDSVYLHAKALRGSPRPHAGN